MWKQTKVKIEQIHVSRQDSNLRSLACQAVLYYAYTVLIYTNKNFNNVDEKLKRMDILVGFKSFSIRHHPIGISVLKWSTKFITMNTSIYKILKKTLFYFFKKDKKNLLLAFANILQHQNIYFVFLQPLDPGAIT